MKTLIRKLLEIRVHGLLFLLTCLLLAGFGMAAKQVADEIALQAEHICEWAGTPAITCSGK